MSLYNHVLNKDDLLDGMIDVVGPGSTVNSTTTTVSNAHMAPPTPNDPGPGNNSPLIGMTAQRHERTSVQRASESPEPPVSTARTASTTPRLRGHVHDAEGGTKRLSAAHVSDVMGDGLKPFHAA